MKTKATYQQNDTTELRQCGALVITRNEANSSLLTTQKMKKLLLSFLLLNCSFIFNEAFAQDGFGIGNNDPQELLDVSGAIKIGGSTVGALDAGTIRWNGSRFQGYNGTNWVNLDDPGAPTPTAEHGVSIGVGTLDLTLTGTGWTFLRNFWLTGTGKFLIRSQVSLSQNAGSHARFRLFTNTTVPNSEFETISNGADVTATTTSDYIFTKTSNGLQSIKLEVQRVAGYNRIRSDANGRTTLTVIKLQ